MTKKDDKRINDLLSKFPHSQDNEKATVELLSSFPEFENSKFYGQTDDHLSYMVFADFCRFLRDQISAKNKQDLSPLLGRVSEFVKKLYYSKSHDLKDLARVGMLESLANDEKTKILVEFLPREIADDFETFFKN